MIVMSIDGGTADSIACLIVCVTFEELRYVQRGNLLRESLAMHNLPVEVILSPPVGVIFETPGLKPIVFIMRPKLVAHLRSRPDANANFQPAPPDRPFGAVLKAGASNEALEAWLKKEGLWDVLPGARREVYRQPRDPSDN